MNNNKTFDAVEMKNAIQAKHRGERMGMSPEQVRRSIAERLNTADDPLSRLWRRLTPDRAEQPSVGKA